MLVSQSQTICFFCGLLAHFHLWPLSLDSENPPWASSVLLRKVDVICRRSRLQRRSWEFQRCWMQKTWWLLRFPTASVSWHTSPSTTTTSMDVPRVGINVSQSQFLPLFCLFFQSHNSICLFINVFAAVGGMGGIKRPADDPTEEPSGKKNQPVTSKVFPSSKPARENSPPPSSNITRPSPSPKQTRNATQVIFAVLVLYTSYESNWSVQKV